MSDIVVTLKTLRLTGDRYAGKIVKLTGACFSSAKAVVIKGRPMFRLSLEDDEGDIDAFADKAQFAEQVLQMSDGDYVEVVGRVVVSEDNSQEVFLLVTQLDAGGTDSDDDDSDDDDEDDEDDDDYEENDDTSSPGRATGVGDVTDRIERLDLFEERLGVNLECLSAFVDGNFVTVRGELHPRHGTELERDVELIAAVYDATSRVIGTSSQTVYAEDFFGIETFEMLINLPVASVARVRVYPKKR